MYKNASCKEYIHCSLYLYALGKQEVLSSPLNMHLVISLTLTLKQNKIQLLKKSDLI